MDKLNTNTGHKPRPETEAQQQAWIAWEAEGIAVADAELGAGLYVDAADVHAWIESICTDHELPPPSTSHRLPATYRAR